MVLKLPLSSRCLQFSGVNVNRQKFTMMQNVGDGSGWARKSEKGGKMNDICKQMTRI